jgi:competence protein ComEA
MRLSQLAAALSLLLVSPAFAQTAAPAAKPPSTSVAPATAAPAATPTSTLIDINTAPKDQLDALPQIGTARADAIIKGRPYKSKNELLDRKIIPQSAYDAIKNKIVARQKS